MTIVTEDLLDGHVMTGEGVLDTRSVLSFISADVPGKAAPSRLKELQPCQTRITGITGEEVNVLGTITLPCEVADGSSGTSICCGRHCRTCVVGS